MKSSSQPFDSRSFPRLEPGHLVERSTHKIILRMDNAPSPEIAPDVQFHEDLRLVVWKPRGILDQSVVNEIVAFIDAAEAKASKPFNRFADLSALDAVDLNFKFVFDIALHRRLSYAQHSPVKSAFYVTSPATAHYAKLHAMLTDYSPLDVALFTERAAAAKWLGVPVEALMVPR